MSSGVSCTDHRRYCHRGHDPRRPDHRAGRAGLFKGTFGAAEVAGAIARGLEDAGRPADRCPVADGGEGTLAALMSALGARRAPRRTDPLGREIEANSRSASRSGRRSSRRRRPAASDW